MQDKPLQPKDHQTEELSYVSFPISIVDLPKLGVAREIANS